MLQSVPNGMSRKQYLLRPDKGSCRRLYFKNTLSANASEKEVVPRELLRGKEHIWA
jgi:hypothetical protein